MPTNSKTPKLGLNSWVGTDKPLRQDFVDDNTLIDSLLGGHLEDTDVHLTEGERARLEAPFTFTLLGGTGEASCEHALAFAPSLVLVYQNDEPLAAWEDGHAVCNAAIAGQEFSSGGALLNANSLTLYQSQAAGEGVFYNLNLEGGQYTCVAFR